ncbi:hypothetical protein CBM2629_B90105 [Cupriavidus taiwanensis]|nr:hypothetical protein CBM2629_B90105 [Cupriavidus taiwanensis]
MTHEVRSESHENVSSLAMRGVGMAWMVMLVAHTPSDVSLDRSYDIYRTI